MKGRVLVVPCDWLPCTDYDDVYMQNAYYEGYICNVEVTTIIVFNDFGGIIHAGVNVP